MIRDNISTSRLYLRSFLPVISGLLLGLSRLPVGFDMLAFVAFVPIFYYIDSSLKLDVKKKTIFFDGVYFSTVFLLISIHWISLVTIPGFLGILLIFGAVFGGMFLFASMLAKSIDSIWSNGKLCFILAWLLFEFGTNFTEFSFPWFSIAYGLKNSLSLLQLLEIGGIPFLSFLILVINYLFYIAITKKKKYFIIAFSILIIWFIIGNLRLHHVQKNTIKEDIKISMIQGNIEQNVKWDEEMLDHTFEIYENLSREAVAKDSPDLIIYPESALPIYLFIFREYYMQLMGLVLETQTPIFTGFPHMELGVKHKGQLDPYLYYNAANLFSPEYFAAENYYKNILVPFGERIPLLSQFPFLWRLDFGQANFERGESAKVYSVLGQSFSPLICFEIAFPMYLRNIFRDHKPDFWVNITNDAWFYRSIGTAQHAMMATYRTIETRSSVFRVANTGYSFFTSPDGRIHQMTELFETTFITGNLFVYKGVTPFITWGYFFPYICMTLFALQILGTLFCLYQKKRLG